MRILFSFTGGNGHFVPMISVARATEAAGHTIAFGCGPSMAPAVKAAGFDVFPLGTPSTDGPPERYPLRPIDLARDYQEFRDKFVQREGAIRAPLTMELCAEWQPDLLVIEECDFGSIIAAERLGLPYANLLVTAAGSFVRAEVVGEALNELRAAHDLPPDPELEMLRRYLVLSPFPPSFRDPAYRLPATAFSFRPPMRKEAANLDWSPTLPDAPTVYFTLGTIFNMESGDLFTRVLDGLRDLPINAVVTVGNDINPEEFGPQPPNISIRCYIAQEAILPHCELVISHGGSGSVAGALMHGLPMVVIPMGADQPLNAARCVQLGVGRMLDPIEATPEMVRAAVSNVLTDPRYRLAAEHIRDEFAALPGPEHTIKLLEQLAVEQRPVLL